MLCSCLQAPTAAVELGRGRGRSRWKRLEPRHPTSSRAELACHAAICIGSVGFVLLACRLLGCCLQPCFGMCMWQRPHPHAHGSHPRPCMALPAGSTSTSTPPVSGTGACAGTMWCQQTWCTGRTCRQQWCPRSQQGSTQTAASAVRLLRKSHCKPLPGGGEQGWAGGVLASVTRGTDSQRACGSDAAADVDSAAHSQLCDLSPSPFLTFPCDQAATPSHA